MANGIKIATIGGGSSYTPELVEGFIRRYENLPVDELWLVDIPEGQEKLDTVGALAQRMVKRAGLPTKVVLTTDRRAALDGADFVTSQVRIGRLPARVLDERIPLSHGMLGQETNGAGGMFKAFRTIPVILDFVREVQELCPDAWMINFSNPSGMIEEPSSTTPTSTAPSACATCPSTCTPVSPACSTSMRAVSSSSSRA